MTVLAPPMPMARTPVPKPVPIPVAIRTTPPPPDSGIGVEDLFRISVEQYHRMIDLGIIPANEPVELLEGLLVKTMSRKPPHCHAVRQLNRWFGKYLPDEWVYSCQGAMTVDTSEPEPDLVIMRGPESQYRNRHPGPADVGLVIEVSETSLAYDEGFKLALYARNDISEYWIVNVIEGRFQVYSEPTGPCDSPTYVKRVDYGIGMSIPVTLDGQLIGSIPADYVLF